eukprot:1134680-Amphidinium_carterae.1
MGPQEKLRALGPSGKQYLLAGQRRQAQATLRNNERAINTRFASQLNGAKATPDQQRRFAEAKARKLPWTDRRTTRFILEGVDFSEPMEELGEPALRGLGEPAPGAGDAAAEQQEAELPPPGGHPDQGTVPAEEPPPADGAQNDPPPPVAPPAADTPLALPTDQLEFQDAEE